MRVLFLAQARHFGGGERQLINLTSGLQERGHDVRVLVFGRSDVLEEHLRRASVPHGRWTIGWYWDVASIVVGIARLVLRHRPDVVVSWSMALNVPALTTKLVARGTTTVWAFRNSENTARREALSRLGVWFHARCAGLPDLAIVNSEAGARDELVRRLPARRVRLLRNGIDTSYFRPQPAVGKRVRREWGFEDGQRVIGLAARFDPMKDHETFLRAAALAVQDDPSLRFVCIGDDDFGHRTSLERRAHRLGLHDRIVWSGVRADMPAVYSAFDLATLTSAYGEGCPNAVAEAMACGVPCVVTDVGDAAEIVGDLGVVVPPEDPDRLCAAWRAMLNEQHRGRAGERRGRIVGRFAVEDMVARAEQVLGEHVRNGAAATP